MWRHHDVIVVKPDGYNRNPDEDYYLRPYNVSPVETQRQYPIYFPELVEYIDAQYQPLLTGTQGHIGSVHGWFHDLLDKRKIPASVYRLQGISVVPLNSGSDRKILRLNTATWICIRITGYECPS